MLLFYWEKKTKKPKECVSNATAVQKLCRNNKAKAKGPLCSATKKTTLALDKTKIRSPESVCDNCHNIYVKIMQPCEHQSRG